MKRLLEKRTLLKKITVNFLLLTTLFILSPISQSIAQISVGDTLQYRIITSKISAEVGTNFVSSEGFNFLGDNYPQGTLIKVYVNLVGEGMNGNFTINEKTLSFGYPVDSYITNLFPDFPMKTSQLTYSLIDFWEREYFEEGFYLYLYPYIDPIEECWKSINETGNALVAEFDYYKELGLDVDCTYIFQEKANRVYFETWNKGKITNQFEETPEHPFDIPANYSFENHFQIVYEKESGQMLGMHMKGWTKGKITNGIVDVSMDYKIEKVAYNLPWFKIKNANRILVGVFVPILVIGIASIPTVIIIRKRRLRETNGIQMEAKATNFTSKKSH